jgi:hypothetical protein
MAVSKLTVNEVELNPLRGYSLQHGVNTRSCDNHSLALHAAISGYLTYIHSHP